VIIFPLVQTNSSVTLTPPVIPVDAGGVSSTPPVIPVDAGGVSSSFFTSPVAGVYQNFNLYNHVTSTLQVSVAGLSSITITLPPSVIVWSNYATVPALIVGDWPDGIQVTIINQGFISGNGGRGGNGGQLSPTIVLPQAGGNGSTAIFCTVPCTIINEGTIQGGGGGGGGGSYTSSGASGCGGGAGIGNGIGGLGFVNGGNSTLVSPGAGGVAAPGTFVVNPGSGGNGGRWVEVGGVIASDGIGKNGGSVVQTGGIGGQPGKAIDYNGQAVSLTDNGTIYGATS